MTCNALVCLSWESHPSSVALSEVTSIFMRASKSCGRRHHVLSLSVCPSCSQKYLKDTSREFLLQVWHKYRLGPKHSRADLYPCNTCCIGSSELSEALLALYQSRGNKNYSLYYVKLAELLEEYCHHFMSICCLSKLFLWRESRVRVTY